MKRESCKFEENPGSSIRRVSRMLGLSRYMVHHILRVNGLHPYHYQRVQLFARDQQQRVNFCGDIFRSSLFNVYDAFNKY